MLKLEKARVIELEDQIKQMAAQVKLASAWFFGSCCNSPKRLVVLTCGDVFPSLRQRDRDDVI